MFGISIALERSLRPIKTSDKLLGALSLWAAVFSKIWYRIFECKVVGDEF